MRRISIVYWSVFILFEKLHFTYGNPKSLQEIHKSMDAFDLSYHFGVNDVSQVPPYEVISPVYPPEYQSFPELAASQEWIYPIGLHFDIVAFDQVLSVSAVRNEFLTVPEFSVDFYGKDGITLKSVKPDHSVLKRHYIGFVQPKLKGSEKLDLNEPNGAFSFSEDGVRGLLQSPEKLLRITPFRSSFRTSHAENFDIKDSSLQERNHIVYEISRRPQKYQFQTRKKIKKKTRGLSRSPIKASMKLGVLADYTFYRALTDWELTSEPHQIFFVLSFYNEIQVMYREKKLKRSVQLLIALQSLGFFTHPQNDLGADPNAEFYLDNICHGPYNNRDLDHLQALTYMNIFFMESKRLKAYSRNGQLDLPRPIRYKEVPGYRPKFTNHMAPSFNREYETIGLANLGSTCKTKSHCTVVEMNSAIPSFAGAHEIAHAIGVEHEEDSGCPFDPKDLYSSSFMSATSWGSNSWATLGKIPVLTDCSIKSLADNLMGKSSCLVKSGNEKPNPSLNFKKILRSKFYSYHRVNNPGNFQILWKESILDAPLNPSAVCKVIMGELWMDFRKWNRSQVGRIFAPLSETGDEMCRSLDCKVTSSNMPYGNAYGMKFGPALPGTLCSPAGDKVCYNFKCVDISSVAG